MTGWLSARWTRVLFGVAIGGLVGLAIYQGSQLTGRSLFILCGGTAGAVAALIVHGYSRAIRLTDVTISVPQFSDLHFTVTKDSQQVAWKLFVETTTRIAVQPMDHDAGLLREALDSLHGIFLTTREILKQTHPSRRTGRDPTVEHLAIAMLNNEIRPFLATWHPQLQTWERAHPDGQEAQWPGNADCRTELANLQRSLTSYIMGFGKLARVPNTKEIIEGSLDGAFSESPGG